MQLRAGVLGLVLVLISACGPHDVPNLGVPRIEIHVSGGDEGARWSLGVNAKGQFFYQSSGDDGRGTIHWTRCEGEVSADSFAPWFDELARARMVPPAQAPDLGKLEYPPPAVVNEHFELTYTPSEGQSLVPADLDEHLRLRALGHRWMDDYGKRGDCKSGKLERE